MAHRTKVAAPARLPDRERRVAALEAAGYNLFSVPSETVYVDLLTDSGTGAMSEAQWAAMMTGDEAYAGSRSHRELAAAVAEVTGFERFVPVHQGRGGENVLYGALLSAGDVVPNNTHFDTTRAHVANQGAEAVDCPVALARESVESRGSSADSGKDPDADPDFLGNLSVARVRDLVAEVGADRVPAVVVTLTNNSMAGQPVSVENVARARALADEFDAHLVLDACRFAENAHFVREREPGYGDRSVAAIAREQLGYADALVVSGKKDGLANVGGFVAVADDHDELFERVRERAILYEGFTTYGGMAGRDLAAMAVGLREAVKEAYVAGRVEQVQYLADELDAAGVPVYLPAGGHAVYLDAAAFVPHVPPEQFPGQSLAVELYREGAVRGVELGSLAFPGADRPEFVRLAVPRRTYHREHLDHVVDTVRAVHERREELVGYRVVEEPATPELRHFTASLTPVEGS
jgi:tryptophanase